MQERNARQERYEQELKAHRDHLEERVAAAGTIGAHDLSASAKALQDAFHDGPEASVPALVACFQQELHRVLQGLKAHFGQNRTEP